MAFLAAPLQITLVNEKSADRNRDKRHTESEPPYRKGPNLLLINFCVLTSEMVHELRFCAFLSNIAVKRVPNCQSSRG